MNAAIILEGQVYYDEEKNDYLVVTANNRGVISYSGHGFRGLLGDDAFIERFQPVDPADLTPAEEQQLLSFCRPGTQLKIGFIMQGV